MATVRALSVKDLGRVALQGDVEATVSTIGINREEHIQVDTYGSPDRLHAGKQSQSLRLTEAAFDQLSKIAGKHF